ncbi:MAG: bifunctional enoyl-CoA hydratase/phosphate acetyltransferase [bacterium]|nr:bifunctional enoyl-CoA hydratase/phosphate acetyltransferase [Rhodocyclaceae bacterium]
MVDLPTHTPHTPPPAPDGNHLATLLARARALPPAATAVAWPLSRDALAGPVDAAAEGLIEPWLVGPMQDIRALAERESLDLRGCRVVDTPDPVQAAMHCARLARDGEVTAIMKGSLHTDELMAAVVARESGLRTARRISHAFVMGVPAHPRLFIITDAAVNIAPDLEAKRDIVQNAIELAHALGVPVPKVALLAAVETVNPKMPATLDAAALCKMADRGQISGGMLDGPLALDNALSAEAARIKGIVSPVSGRPDILVAPDIEAGNMMYKQLVFFSGAFAAGLVLGARVPVILTSRADGRSSRLASCAVARLAAPPP